MNTFSELEFRVPNVAREAGLTDFYPTGSRAFCCGHDDSDADYLCRGTVRQANNVEGGLLSDTASMKMSQNFYSIRVGKVNLIVALTDDFYERFLLATKVCMAMAGPEEKRYRVFVFRAILYGEAPQ